MAGQTAADAVRADWRKRKQRQRAAARAAGICTRCVIRKAKEGGVYCVHCLRKIAALR